MTLDDLERPYALCFKIHAFSEPTTIIWKKDRRTLSATKMQLNDSSSWQYEIYADIRGGSLDRGSKDSDVVENGKFQYSRSLFLLKLYNCG